MKKSNLRKKLFRYISLERCNDREVGSMVREAIKRGKQAITEETKANGEMHQNAKNF